MKKNQAIRVGFSEEDLSDLRRGRVHNWTFLTDRGEKIDIELYNEDLETDEDEDDN